MKLWEKLLYKSTGICTHSSLMRDHEIIQFYGINHTQHGQRCNQCFKFFPFSKVLLFSEGAYAAIEQRLEQERELANLVAKAEVYRMEAGIE